MSTAAPKLRDIADKSKDFDRWYTDVIRRAELADYAPVKGCMVIRPYGFAIWERVQRALDDMIKRTGHENMYFPLLIPESYLMKEADHIEGFNPQVAWVTHGGGKELEERLAIRPTSETIICSMYKDWIHSYRDLPVLINQWANVMRWEKRTRMFLRTTEFLWQEGHTFHETETEAAEEVERMLGCYRELAEDWLALPVIPGRKTESEKFAGANYTLSIEAMMSDHWALQAGTSHHLGQNFTKAYEITYTDRNNTLQFPYQTSWGVSTRIIGGIIMGHGDERGLVLPPRIAPIQVAVVPIKSASQPEMDERIDEICDRLEKSESARVRIDRRDSIRPGEKYAHWELRGVPLRITIGAKDLAENVVTVTRRLDGQSWRVAVEAIDQEMGHWLDEAQHLQLQKARQMLADNTVEVKTIKELQDVFAERPVFANAPFCNSEECEKKVTESVHALTVRNLRQDREGERGTCVACGQSCSHVALLARAY